MKKYALYPGVGRVTADRPLAYIDGRQLAACYRVPYSQCLDCSISEIKKVITFAKDKGNAPVYLLHLLPKESGKYQVPTSLQNKIIVVKGLTEQVNTNG